MNYFGVLNVLILAGCILTVHAPHPHEAGVVDAAVSNVDMYFDHEVCKALEHVDCKHYHTQHDERICGTDGKTYPNHCEFARARCTHHESNGLSVSNHGPCQHHIVAINHIVNTALQNVSIYYDHSMCEAIEHIDCLHYHTQHDSQICGTDGITYNNHCEFAMARCKLILDPNNYNPHTHTSMHMLLLNNQGACQQPQTITTNLPNTTNHPASTLTTSKQSVAINTTQSPMSTTVLVSATSAIAVAITLAPTASNALPSTTTMSLQSIMQSVFCININAINCNTAFNVVCGSDGQYYPNDCELAKAGCSNPGLKKEDITKCTATVP